MLLFAFELLESCSVLITSFNIFTVNINMSNKRRKEISKRKLLVNVSPNWNLYIHSSLSFYIYAHTHAHFISAYNKPYGM